MADSLTGSRYGQATRTGSSDSASSITISPTDEQTFTPEDATRGLLSTALSDASATTGQSNYPAEFLFLAPQLAMPTASGATGSHASVATVSASEPSAAGNSATSIASTSATRGSSYDSSFGADSAQSANEQSADVIDEVGSSPITQTAAGASNTTTDVGNSEDLTSSAEITTLDDSPPGASQSVVIHGFPKDLAAAGWIAGEDGGTASGAGSVAVESGDAVLTEGDSFLVTFEHTFQFPADASTLAFTYSDLQFDTSDPDFINDAFEVALLDDDGYSLVDTTSANRDVFFNITEGLPAVLADGVTVESQTVTLDVSGVPVDQSATLVFRLVNNDSDTTSSVRITGAGIPGADDPPEISIRLESDTAPVGPGTENYRTDRLTNDPTVTGSVIDDLGISRLEARVDQGDFTEFTSTLEDDQYRFDPGTLAPGPHTITVRAWDTGEQSAEASIDFTVNAPPVADAGGDRTIAEGATIGFDGASSFDTEDEIFAYRWTFADGSTVEEATASRQYLQDGVFQVELAVTDTAGSVDTDTIDVNVENLPPEIASLADREIDEGDNISFTTTFADPGILDSHTATIDWGDGTVEQASVVEQDGAGTVSGSHTYPDDGTYQVTVTVTDDGGATGETAFTVEVKNLAPIVLTATDMTGAEGQSLDFTATFTDPGDIEPHSATIDWGDGTTSVGNVVEAGGDGAVTASHVYADNGTYDIRLNVSDSQGHASTADAVASIENVAPTLEAYYAYPGSPVDGDHPLVIEIWGAFDDPGFDRPEAGTNETFTLSIDWGDGTVELVTPETEPGSPGIGTHGRYQVRHTYDLAGVYEPKIVVADDDGGTDSASLRYGLAHLDVKPAVRNPVWNPFGGSLGKISLPHGLIPVVIPSGPSFDATRIQADTLRFFPGIAHEVNDELLHFDVTGDGLLDAIAHFSTWDARIRPTDSVCSITGQLDDGTYFSAFDAIRVTGASGRIPDALNPPDASASDTKFFVVDDEAGQTFRYRADGSENDSFLLESTLTDPRGVTSNATGDTLWIVDGTNHLVEVHGPDGWLLGAWVAQGLDTPEGIATDGTDIWIVDAGLGHVLRYDDATLIRSMIHHADASFDLHFENVSPTGIATDGSTIWVSDDVADQAFVYDTAGTFLGQWSLDPENGNPSGITNDPAGGADLWLVDREDLLVYHYAAATDRTGGTALADDSFSLVASNISPEGIADPPTQTGDGDSLLDENGVAVFITSEDFLLGDLFNVNVSTEPGVLGLNEPELVSTFPYLWIPNLNGSLSKIDVNTGNEIARYWTAPENKAGAASPSRTTVGADGSCALGNRGIGSVVIFGHEDFIDQNGNGVCDTSADTDGDGNIAPNEMLPFGKDEKLLYEVVYTSNESVTVYRPGVNGEYHTGSYLSSIGPRGIAFDQDGRLWVGGRDSMWYHVFDPSIGEIVDSLHVGDLSQFTFFDGTQAHGSHKPYGAVVDQNGYLWSASLQGSPHSLIRINTSDSSDVKVIHPGHQVYGMGLDTNGHLFVNGWQSERLMKVDTETGTILWSKIDSDLYQGRGVAVTNDGDVWAVSTNRNHIVRYDNDGNEKARISSATSQTGRGPYHPSGVAIDANGYLWACDIDDNYIHRIDPDTNEIDISKEIVDSGGHYTYSDMTGQVLFTQFNPGTWTEVLDSDRTGTPWEAASISADTPTGATTQLRVRTSDERALLDATPWTKIESGEPLHDHLGRYLEIELAMRTSDESAIPHVEEIAVGAMVPPSISVSVPSNKTELPANTPVLLQGTAIADSRSDLTQTSIPNRIIAVTVNGQAVDALDGAGNFFAQTMIVPGENVFEVTAIDAFGQRATETVSVFGSQQGDGTADTLQFELSPSFAPDYARTSYDERTDLLHAEMAIENVGQYSADRPFYVGVVHISDPTVSVHEPVGVTADGVPYYDLSELVLGDALDPAEMTLHSEVAFHNPDRVPFTYELVFVYAVNEAPVFDSVPVLEAHPGLDYTYPAHATDPDGDTLTYSLPTAPRGMSIDPDTGMLTWTPDALGTHTIVVRADDARGGTAEQRYELTVSEAPPNRPPVITSVPVTEAEVAHTTAEQEELLDVSTWDVLTFENTYGNLSSVPNTYPNWELADPPVSVTQTVNANASVLLGDFDVSNDRISGTWRVDDTGSDNSANVDDDFIGFVFGYRDEGHFYLFDWRQADQDRSEFDATGSTGMTVKAVAADTPLTVTDLWNTAGNEDRVRTLFHNDVPWENFADYQFELVFNSGQFTITVSQGETLIETITLYDETYVSGRFGFYNYSQGLVTYSGFTRQSVPELTYRYDVDATDPDFDPLTYSLLDGPDGMQINPADGLITWAPSADQLGQHTVTVEATDPYGAKDSQTFVVEVLPDPDNHPPVIVSDPITRAVVGTEYTCAVEAVDFDDDQLEYRLVDAPEDMSIAHDTGIIRWSPDSTDIGPHTTTVQVVDGRGGSDTQTFVLEVLDAGSGTVSGTVYDDLNRNGLRDSELTEGDSPLLVFVIDASGSMAWGFTGTDVGDVNGDGRSNDRLDGTVAGIELLHSRLVDMGLGDTAQLAVVRFAWDGSHVDVDPSISGVQWLTIANADKDSNGVPDFVQAVRSIRIGGATNHRDGLAKARAVVEESPELAENANVLFFTDGDPGDLTSGASEAELLRGMGASVRAFGIGTGASLSVLQQIDSNAVRFGTADELFDTFAGLSGSIITYLEPGLADRTVYVDLDANGRRTPGEPFGVSDVNGTYHVTDVPAGNYELRMESFSGWEQTQPWSGSYQIQFNEGSVVRGKDFGAYDLHVTGSTPYFVSEAVDTAEVSTVYRYDAEAVDPENDPLTYELTVGPDGMTVHPQLGIVVWQPTIDKVGQNQVVLKVSDGNGGIDIQSFFVDVEPPNSPPAITTESVPDPIQAETPFEVILAAQDADGDAFTFSLDEGAPDGMAIDPESGTLTWTPTTAQIGEHAFTLVVTDEHGLATTKTYSTNVVETLPNDPPVIHSSPRTRSRIDMPYFYAVDAVDPNGDPIAFALDAGAPAGMTISQAGLLEWLPTSADLGTHEVTLRVTDGRGGETPQTFTLEIVPDTENTAPRITSNPPLSTILGRTYTYAATASDAEGDSVVWRLDEAPRGMSINALSGLIYWTPEGDQRGGNQVVVRATDTFGASRTQSFTIDVRGVNLPPMIDSSPDTAAFVDQLYVYSVGYADPDGDDVTFSFAADIRPDGMAIDAETGLITWTPTADQTGPHAVSVLVRDDYGGIDIQAFTIQVTDANFNASPVITSTPVYNVATGHDYGYPVAATDPEGDALSFALDAESLARGMTVDDATGQIAWSPAAADVGSHSVTVTVADPAGNLATQSYTLSVRENQAPSITSPPITAAAAGIGYAYDVQATDPEDDSIDYLLTEGPSGMTIDQQGRIRWNPSLDLMGTSVDVTVVAVDEIGAESEPQSFTVTVREDTTPPQLVLAAATNMAHPGDSVRFQVRATDDVGVGTVVLLVDGTPHAVTPDGDLFVADLPFNDPGLVEVVAQATDLAGNSATSDSWEVRVFDPTDQESPIVTIHALIPQEFDEASGGLMDGDPIEGDALYLSPVLSYLTDLELSITDDNLGDWRIEYAPTNAVDTSNLGADDPDYKLLAAGTGELDHERFQLDTTLMANDAYLLRVSAYDVNGQGWVEPLVFGVSSNAKLGNFTFTVTDVAVSLAGIPIQVNRTYDTLQADREGDFGYGWTMSIAGANIAETTRAGTEMQPGDRVYLTNPEGKRVGFTYEPELIAQGGLFLVGIEYVPQFTPDPGVYDELTVKEGSYMRGGVFGSIIGALSSPWNPSQYVLTTRDGTVYEYVQDEGLQKITDSNDNQVTFTDSAITHSAGAEISLVRDARGRITQIVDTAGNSVTYTYDAAGDLASFSNQIDTQSGTATTSYGYRNDPAHFLDEIHDSAGVRIFKAEFDDDGRLTGSTDALGNVVQQDFNPAAFEGTITDARGNVTVLRYNEQGTVLEEESPAVTSGVTGESVVYTKSYEYGDTHHPDKETKIVEYDGTVVEYEYDAAGNTTKTTRTSPDGTQSAVNEYDYDADDNLTMLVGPGGGVSTFTYSDGNATSVTSALGHTAYATYGASGKQESFTDFAGNTTVYDYKDGCPCGTPKKVTHPDGSYELREWNRQALVTKVEYYEADGTLVYLTTTDYDALGRKVRETVGAGEDEVVTRYTYDGNTENVTTETIVHPTDESRNRVTHYFYDDAGNLIRQVDPDLDPGDPDAGIFFKYDANGNRVWLMDPVGNVTTWIYDSLDRVIEERDPLYWDGTDWASMTDTQILDLLDDPTPTETAPYDASHITRYAYDGADNLVEQIDRNGRRRTFEYDHQGNMLQEVWYDAVDDVTPIREMTFTYDTAGNMLTAVDPDAEYVFTYDTMNRLETMAVDYPWAETFDTFSIEYEYDAMGNVVSATDSTGVAVKSSYDSRNQLDSRWWEGDSVDNIRADFDYTAVGQLDHVDRWADKEQTTPVGSSDYVYDLAGRIRAILHKNATDEVLAGYDYEFDFAGLLTREVLDHITDAYDRTADYGYDARGQLISALYDNDQPDETFSYDANGNRTMPGYVTGPGNQLLSDGTFKYTYDAEGNMVTKTRIAPVDGEVNFTEYEYDFRNRMTKVTQYSKSPGEGGIILHEESYRYDALGRRIQVVSDGEETISVYDDRSFMANEWARFNAAGEVTQRFLFTNRVDQLVAQWTAGQGTAWALSDHLGTIRDMVDNAGQIVQHIDYTAFGIPTFAPPTGNTHPFALTGRPWDSISSLSYHRARFYDPITGSFVTHDPIGFSGGDSNLFAYVGNEPLNATDPTGEMAFIQYVGAVLALSWIGFNTGLAYHTVHPPDCETEFWLTQLGFTVGAIGIVFIPFTIFAFVSALAIFTPEDVCP